MHEENITHIAKCANTNMGYVKQHGNRTDYRLQEFDRMFDKNLIYHTETE